MPPADPPVRPCGVAAVQDCAIDSEAHKPNCLERNDSRLADLHKKTAIKNQQQAVIRRLLVSRQALKRATRTYPGGDRLSNMVGGPAVPVGHIHILPLFFVRSHLVRT